MSQIALHGFLGLPSDWEPQVIAYPIKEAISFTAWVKEFNRWAATQSTPRTLIGYSMGGRLALHSLIADPSLWDSAILISTHPGLTTGHKERLAHDQAWAQRFLHEDWDPLMQAWNEQPIFNPGKHPIRLEHQFNRNHLASQLDHFSLGRQEYLVPKLPPLPLLWITGSLDSKFESLAKMVVAHHPTSTHRSIPGVSHRVHLDFLHHKSQ